MISLLLAGLLQEPLSPAETVRKLHVPAGFKVSLFAGEPDLVQPVAFSIDDRGRVWAVEGLAYPHWLPKDRIIILEDADNDGTFDKKTLFIDKLTYVTGIETGFGGVFVTAPPQMLFIPDRNGDDVPDGPPEVLLDGFGLEGKHNIVSGFSWGPDGWLYAGHGRTSISDIGPPGTPPEKRIRYDGGVWRWHPVRKVFEAFCDGTTNPWGVAFDENGEAFISTCVDVHLYHAIQGAHYEPWRNRPSSRHAYKRIDAIADHLHYKGPLQTSRGGPPEQLAVGGGHAHSGAYIYLGDSFPAEYRGTFFTNNIHGKRVNNDLLRRRGSGFAAGHGPDFLVSDDPMHMGVLVQGGPDGSLFVSDWYDRGECHTRNPHQLTGRIYKVSYGERRPPPVDLAKLTTEELMELQFHKNDWIVTRARRLLQERQPKLSFSLKGKDRAAQLRAIWALRVTGNLGEPANLQTDGDEYVRAWGIRLDLEDGEAFRPATLLEMAKKDPSAVVRLWLASACQRMPLNDRYPLLEALAGRMEDVEDPNLPLMIWYALEPWVAANRDAAVELMKKPLLPPLREFITRRLVAR
ncbi:MAG TPA: PVC-type heme-binding CxxCH protein [Planctomycetota bacterium]